MNNLQIESLVAEKVMGWHFWDFRGDYNGEYPMYRVSEEAVYFYRDEQDENGSFWNPINSVDDAMWIVHQLEDEDIRLSR